MWFHLLELQDLFQGHRIHREEHWNLTYLTLPCKSPRMSLKLEGLGIFFHGSPTSTSHIFTATTKLTNGKSKLSRDIWRLESRLVAERDNRVTAILCFQCDSRPAKICFGIWSHQGTKHFVSLLQNKPGQRSNEISQERRSSLFQNQPDESSWVIGCQNGAYTLYYIPKWQNGIPIVEVHPFFGGPVSWLSQYITIGPCKCLRPLV